LSIYLICSFIYFFAHQLIISLGLCGGLVVLGNLLAFEVDFITAELQHLNVLEEVPSYNENRNWTQINWSWSPKSGDFSP